jgi:glycosyltransferase involved in cell wall biosynthesis
MYAEDFAIARPAVVRNAPAFVDQPVREVDSARVNLVHHGFAEMSRGLHLLVDALPLLDKRFVLNLMLTGSSANKDQLMSMSGAARNRIFLIDPVPMNEVATALNRFDLELIFFPPSNKSFEFALPNKFFEAVQGRLGIVIGHSESMLEITEEFGNALVVDGWTAKNLATAINALTTADIQRLKDSSAACARAINAEAEAELFLKSIAL